MTVYTDGNGTYFAPGSLLTGDPSKQIVNVRTVDYYTSATMATATVQAKIQNGWTIAPNLTDIGGGEWVNGQLVDPQENS